MTCLPGVATVRGALSNLRSLVKYQGPDHARLLLGHEENKAFKIFEKNPSVISNGNGVKSLGHKIVLLLPVSVLSPGFCPHICQIVLTNLSDNLHQTCSFTPFMTVCKYWIWGCPYPTKQFEIYTFHCDTNIVWLTLTFITARAVLFLIFIYFFCQIYPGIHKGIWYLNSSTSGRCGNFYSVKADILGVTTTVWGTLGKHGHNSPNGN